MSRLNQLFTAVLLLASPLVASPVRVDVALRAPAEGPPPIVTITARGPSGAGEPVVVEAQAPGAPVLDLTPGVGWQVTAIAPGLWAPSQVVVPVQGKESPAAFVLWKTGTVEGALVPAPGRDLPESMTVRFRTPEESSTPGAPEGEVSCAVDRQARSYACDIPAGNWDLRLRCRGYVSRFEWNAPVTVSKPQRMSPFVLRPGASVVGSVRGDDAATGVAGARITLTPMGAGAGGDPQAQSARELGSSTISGRDGFFQIDGVPAGSYSIQAFKGGKLSAPVHPVRVLEGAETELERSIVLAKPLDLTIEMVPPLDPWGRPWRISLLSKGVLGQDLDEVQPAVDVVDGLWVKSGLPPGEYVVSVADQSGSEWAWEGISLGPERTRVSLEIPVIPIQGRVRVGGEPVHARLAFGGARGAVKIVLETDDEGVFSGFLPREGEWPLVVMVRKLLLARQIRAVEVRRREGEHAAHVDVELPGTRVLGRVVSEDGSPVAGASVEANDPDREEWLPALPADDKGRFVMAGFGPGRLRLQALKGTRSSAVVTVEVLEDPNDQKPVELVLSEVSTLDGVVRSVNGPVFGATVQGLTTSQLGIPIETTGFDGRFRIRVPSGVESIHLIVLAPGFSLRTQRVVVGSAEVVEVPVDQSGGDLTIVLGEEIATLFKKGVPLLLRDGCLISPPIMNLWATMNGLGGLSGRSIRVPLLEPGQYGVCFLSRQKVGDVESGGAVPPASCVQIVVPPNGHVQVTLPQGKDS